MSLFKEIYGIIKDTEDGARLGMAADTIKKLVDEDVIPRRYSKGPGVGYPSKEEEEEALGVDRDETGIDDVESDAELDVSVDGEPEAEFGDGEEGSVRDMEASLPEEILSYARELMDQGQSAEEAARSAADMIYDELVAELQGGGEGECPECPEDEIDVDVVDTDGVDYQEEPVRM